MKPMKRRDFLKTAGMGTFGFMATSMMPGVSLLRALGSAEARADGGDHTLIYILLRGGADALSYFPPMPNTALGAQYILGRPDINFSSADQSRVVPLVDRSGHQLPFGIHSNMPELKQLWDDGKMAVIHGFGAVTNNTSHFNQFAYIECGSSKRRGGTGIFQNLKSRAGWNQDFDLVALEPIVPASLHGSNFVLQYSTPGELTALAGAKAVPGLDKTERLGQNYNSIGSIRQIAGKLRDISVQDAATLSAIPTDDSIKISDLQEVARLMKFSKRPKVITVSLTGWDFHSSLTSRLMDTDLSASNNIKALSRSLGALVDSLGAQLQNTTIVVMSEFGRRMVQNGAQGADHGRGGIAMVIGHPSRIVGQKMLYRSDFVERLVSNYSTTKVDRKQIQIPVDYDYRMLLGAVFQKRFGLSTALLRGGGENSVFPEDYTDGQTIISAEDTAVPEMSGLFPEYRTTTRERNDEVYQLLKS